MTLDQILPSTAPHVTIHVADDRVRLKVYRWDWNDALGDWQRSPAQQACSLDEARTYRPVDAIPVPVPRTFALEAWRAP